MVRLVGREPACGLLELSPTAGLVAAPVLVPGDDDVHEPLEEVTLVRGRRPPGVFEGLVRLEVPSGAREREAVRAATARSSIHSVTVSAVATILLCGVDLFFRGKLDALLPGHHLITAENVDAPDVVIADISRIDPTEVADAWPDVPIIGFTNHNDTGGLKAANAAGFDQVLAKSALVERIGGIVDELVAEPR